MDYDDKIYSDEKKPNISPDVAKWEKSNKDDDAKVEKNPDGVVEKTMESLVEKGKEGPVPKVMASAPKYIQHKGSLYAVAEKQSGAVPGPNEDGYSAVKAPASNVDKGLQVKNVEKSKLPDGKQTMDLIDEEAKSKRPGNGKQTMDLIDEEANYKRPKNDKQTMDLIDEEAKKTANVVRYKDSLYVLAEEKVSDEDVMAAEFGIPPGAVEDLKKYTNDEGTSIFDLASLAKSVNKKEKKASKKLARRIAKLRRAVGDEDINNLDDWEDEQYNYLVIASFDGGASWEIVDGSHDRYDAEDLMSGYHEAYGPSVPLKLHDMSRHYND